MQETELFRWWMPPSAWRKREYLGTAHMSAEQARAAGALRPEPTTRLVIRPGDGGGFAHVGNAPKHGHHLREVDYPAAMDKPARPGAYLYFDAIGSEPVQVEVRDVGECGLGVFFPGRDDYDLLEDVTGTFQPAPQK